ncbi:hypothetical protein PF327_10240 [Sulfurovum sp. XTW-4]|uniref:Permuted papain-like amidase enzyme, YaeF/YiiX, C92 family n=1 Tax=Sulfurovum xiamenensis TaxID=3019066 RepID=A0ABT7QU13_9BACT|nr:hypothetical protein [Sulfurovum xiamenensis]MDM5264572.1 hypothetical protein [Sulfurovum xiamenensis]
MNFERDKDYPIWNPDNIDYVPGIPSWEVKFGDIVISFGRANRFCYVNEKKLNKNGVICGDYFIYTTIPEKYNSHALDDLTFVKLVKESHCDIGDLKKLASDNFDNFKIESQLVAHLLQDSKLSDLCKAFLYYSWHRCIIEERIYSSTHPLSTYKGKDLYLSVIK